MPPASPANAQINGFQASRMSPTSAANVFLAAHNAFRASENPTPAWAAHYSLSKALKPFDPFSESTDGSSYVQLATGMATRNCKAKYEAGHFLPCNIAKEMYYHLEHELEAASVDVSSNAAPSTISSSSLGPAAPVALVAQLSSAGLAAPIDDEPLKAVHTVTLRTIVAQKLKKKIGQISFSKSIKDLVGGKSTLEILGDLQLEFTLAPEKGKGLPRDELAYLGTYFAAGVCVSLSVCGGGGGGDAWWFNLSAIEAYLSKTWGLGPSRADGPFLLGLTLELAKWLDSVVDVKAWFDSVAAAYAQQNGISLSSGDAAESLLPLPSKLDSITGEHGGVQPMFEPLNARHFDSSWNWVMQDALLMCLVQRRASGVVRENVRKLEGHVEEMTSGESQATSTLDIHIRRASTTFKDKKAFGKGSIGVEVQKGLLTRGAQGSKLDYILPFAAVPENGREIDSLDNKAKWAPRISLEGKGPTLPPVSDEFNESALGHILFTIVGQAATTSSTFKAIFGSSAIQSKNQSMSTSTRKRSEFSHSNTPQKSDLPLSRKGKAPAQPKTIRPFTGVRFKTFINVLYGILIGIAISLIAFIIWRILQMKTAAGGWWPLIRRSGAGSSRAYDTGYGRDGHGEKHGVEGLITLLAEALGLPSHEFASAVAEAVKNHASSQSLSARSLEATHTMTETKDAEVNPVRTVVVSVVI
ncbi:hypothetical protein JB92DRAFT_3093129 [Gautieria morchelliformis]|nr:hypothetical protein JB92DRAFT_3093129 [Gautieria morchelliformis]